MILIEHAINSRGFPFFRQAWLHMTELVAGEFCQWDRGRCKVHRGSPSPHVVLCVLLGKTYTPVRRPNTIGRRARARTCHTSFSNGLCRAAAEGTQQREESSVMQNSREGLKNGGNAIQCECRLIYNWGSGERLTKCDAAEKKVF